MASRSSAFFGEGERWRRTVRSICRNARKKTLERSCNPFRIPFVLGMHCACGFSDFAAQELASLSNVARSSVTSRLDFSSARSMSIYIVPLAGGDYFLAALPYMSDTISCSLACSWSNSNAATQLPNTSLRKQSFLRSATVIKRVSP